MNAPSFRLITGVETETTTEQDFLINFIAENTPHACSRHSK